MFFTNTMGLPKFRFLLIIATSLSVSTPSMAAHKDKIVTRYDTTLPCPVNAKETPIKWDKQKNGDQTAIVDLDDWGGKRPVKQVFKVAGTTRLAYRKTYVGPVNADHADENNIWEPLDPPWDPEAFDKLGSYTGPHNVQSSDGFWLLLTDQGPYVVESNYIPGAGDHPLGTNYYRIQNNSLRLVCKVTPN